MGKGPGGVEPSARVRAVLSGYLGTFDAWQRREAVEALQFSILWHARCRYELRTGYPAEVATCADVWAEMDDVQQQIILTLEDES